MLADPTAIPSGDPRGELAENLTRIRDAMLAHPDLIGGRHDRLDTSLMKAAPNRLVSKAGMEALRGWRIPCEDHAPAPTRTAHRGWRSRSRTATATIAAPGRPRSRRCARRACSTGKLLRELARYHRPVSQDPHGRAAAEAIPEFELGTGGRADRLTDPAPGRSGRRGPPAPWPPTPTRTEPSDVARRVARRGQASLPTIGQGQPPRRGRAGRAGQVPGDPGGVRAARRRCRWSGWCGGPDNPRGAGRPVWGARSRPGDPARTVRRGSGPGRAPGEPTVPAPARSGPRGPDATARPRPAAGEPGPRVGRDGRGGSQDGPGDPGSGPGNDAGPDPERERGSTGATGDRGRSGAARGKATLGSTSYDGADADPSSPTGVVRAGTARRAGRTGRSTPRNTPTRESTGPSTRRAPVVRRTTGRLAR